MRNIALFIVAFCVHACLYAQNKATTYVVRDSLTQLAVRGCRVMFDKQTTERTTVTDAAGSFNSPVGATTITISHVAYESKQVDLRKLNGNTIYIVPKNVALKEATITSTTPSNRGSEFSYDARQAASTISIIGEPDVIRHTLSFPGTSFGMEGTLGIFVRGGDTSGNGLHFDGVPRHLAPDGAFLGYSTRNGRQSRLLQRWITCHERQLFVGLDKRFAQAPLWHAHQR